MKPIVIIWFAMLTSVAMFTGVAWFVGSGMRSQLPEVFVFAMLGVAGFNAVLGHVFPRVMKAAQPQARALIGFAFAESASLLSGVTWMLTGDSRCLAGIGVGFVSLALMFPREGRDGETVGLMPPR